MGGKKGTLTAKQECFVQEYLIDLNATQAYLRAGFKVKPASARVQASRLLANPNIASAIEQAMQQRAQRTEVTADRVLKEIARIAFFDIRKLYREHGGGMKDPHELDDDAAAALVSVEVVEEKESDGDGGREVVGFVKKARIADKVAALTLAARHLGMLKERVEHSGPNGGPIETIATMSDAQLQAIAGRGAKP